MNFMRVASCTLAWLWISLAATAQERMPPIPADKLTDAQKKAVTELIEGPRKVVPPPFWPLVRSPQVLSRLQELGLVLRTSDKLGPKLTEFVILMTTRQLRQQYIYLQHARFAEKAALRPDILAAISDGRRPIGMAADEEVVYDFCTELLGNKSVSDETYARAVAKFGEQGVVDMATLSGYYIMVSLVANVDRVPLAKDDAPLLGPFPY
jgi:4-carboxymuconolactone decarboxylase